MSQSLYLASLEFQVCQPLPTERRVSLSEPRSPLCIAPLAPASWVSLGASPPAQGSQLPEGRGCPCDLWISRQHRADAGSKWGLREGQGGIKETSTLPLAQSMSCDQDMHAKSFQLCPTLCNSLDCRPCSSVHRILQVRILEWAAVPSSRGSSRFRD